MNDRERYFEDIFPEYSWEPSTLPCGHILAYACSECKRCYQCFHRVIRRTDDSLWWRCQNGKQHRAVGPGQGLLK